MGEAEDAAAPDDGELRRRIEQADPAEREAVIGEAVRQLAAVILEQPVFGLDSNFLEAGLTSLRAVELMTRLTALSGIEIPLVSVIEHPTPSDLGTFMAGAYDAVAGGRG
jgi:aryl carrier-like protein